MDIRSRLFPLLILITFVSCGKKTERAISAMDSDELQKTAHLALEENDSGRAITSLEWLLHKYPDKPELAKYRIMLGNLHFMKKNYYKADTCFSKHAQMNPGQSEYALYKSVLCKFYQTLGIHRDQSLVKNAIAQAKYFLKDEKYSKGKYASDVKDIIYTCEKKLVDHEIYVFNFYLRQDKFKSAENRIKYIKDTYLNKFKDIEPQILYLESKLAKRRKDKNLAKEKSTLLAQKFPESQYTVMANKMLNKKNDFIFF